MDTSPPARSSKNRAPIAALRAWLKHFILHLPRDKADTLLLLAAAVLVLAPHTLHLPLWVTAVASSAFAAVWLLTKSRASVAAASLT